MLYPNEQYQFQRLTASGLVKKGGGLLGGLVAAQGSANVTIYDGLDNTGTVILNGCPTTAGQPVPCPAQVTVGIYVEMDAAGDITFFYQ